MQGTGAVEKDRDPPMVRMSSLQQQAGEDDEIYQNVLRWCTTADKDTTKAMEDAQFQISELTGSVEENTAMAAAYATKIELTEKELQHQHTNTPTHQHTNAPTHQHTNTQHTTLT